MYVVSECKDAFDNETGKPIKCWYVHMKDFPHIPVWGSFGSKQHAISVCKTMNGRNKHV